jgi:3-oxoadipate enol-lactonase
MTDRLHCFEAGAAEAEGLVFLHGLGMGHRMWQPQLVSLAEDHHVLAPDLPGIAASAHQGPFTLGGAAAAVATEVRERHGRPAHVCGLSLGAMTALQLAADHPDVVRSLVVSGAQVHANGPVMAAQTAVFRLTPEARLLRQVAGFIPSQALAPAVREDLAATGKSALLSVLREVSRVDLRPLLPRIEVPVLVLCGARDRVNLRAARQLAAALPHAELKIVPDAGHVWNLEQPEAFTAAVRTHTTAARA